VKRQHPNAGSQRGFTMIELLVAMTITSVIMVVLFSLVGQSSAGFTQTQRAVNTISQARAFIQFFGRELSTRLPDTPMIHEKGSGSGVGISDKIAFVRTVSIDEQQSATPGDLNLIHYYVAFTQDRANTESPKLFRGTMDPGKTQATLTSPGTPSLPAADPLLDEPIIPNILSFTATPRYYDGSPPVLTDWTSTSAAPPSVIELTIRFIDDSSAQRFKTQAEWDRLADSPRDSELQIIRTFTRSIAIAK
jgi:prepilin-type N-terminal cleavage/methylation domain-containing protein